MDTDWAIQHGVTCKVLTVMVQNSFSLLGTLKALSIHNQPVLITGCHSIQLIVQRRYQLFPVNVLLIPLLL